MAAVLAGYAMTACSSGPAHSARDYASAVAVNDPDGSLTTIVGPGTAIVRMASTVKFPQGDTASGVRSVLMYDRPSGRPARFRVAGTDIGFVAHLERTRYKGTTVTLLEIGDHQAPGSLRVVY